MSSVAPQTASVDDSDSEEEIYYGPTLKEKLEEARSQRSDFNVEGKPIPPASQKRITFLTALYQKEPKLFFISCARWNRKVVKGEIWWSAAGVEKADPNALKQDFSRGIPRNEEQYEQWEKERLEREAVPRTSLGNPKPSASSSSSVKASKSLSLSSRPSKLASSSSSANIPPTSGKRARTASVPTSTSAGPSKRRAISNETSIRQPSLPPPPPPPPSVVTQTNSKSASGSSSKLPKATSSNGSAKSTTSIHFPVTKRSTISPQELSAKGSSSKPSTPAQPAVAPRQPSPKEVAGDATDRLDETIGRGRTPDGRLKGKEVAGRAEEKEKEDEEEGDVSMMEDSGMKMTSLTGWDDMLDADSSAFDLFLPPSFPNDLASSTPNAKPRPRHSSKSNSHLPPLSAPKSRLGDLDGPDAKRKRRRDETLLAAKVSTPASTFATSSTSHSTSIPSSAAASASLPLPTAATPTLPKPTPSRLRPTESLQPIPLPLASISTSLSVPQNLLTSKLIPSRASSSTGTGFSTPSELGPPSSSLGGEDGGSQFPFDLRGSQVEGRMSEISRFMGEEEMEGGSWAS